jgi:tRNA(fMet)-specific endonuclease VapC
MTFYMLDTNIASHVIRGDIPVVRQRLTTVAIQQVAISVVTQAELLYGVAKRGHPKALAEAVHAFLIRVTILPWTEDVAHTYGDLRTASESSGITLAPMDMMIASHAKATGSILVTRDKIFRQPAVGLQWEDWSEDSVH